jgi:DegV family protein with EDD domain
MLMPGIAILTDSCASIPENLLKTLKIHSVAYYIHRGEEVLRDLVTVQREEFLAWLPTAKTLPTTACPGPGDYVAAYEHIIASGQDEIISLHMTSKGSGAYQAATVARDMVLERFAGVKIEVIDTLNVSLCQGWMAIEAARAALEGYSLPDILVMVQRMIPVTRMLQTADTLKYLYMGGRIARAKHLVGSLLNIKPLISMEDGVIVPLGTTRSRQSAYEMIVAEVEKAVGTFRKIKVAYVHAGALPEAEKIKALLEARLEVAESFIAELSPALAVHTGPGTVGVCYFPVG